MAVLTITNGDSAANLLKEAGKDGLVLPWQDALHEGPIKAIETVQEQEHYRQARAKFWSKRGFNAYEDTLNSFAERDQILADHEAFDRIELWFEHDLYDQLQLIEILTRLNGLGRKTNVDLVQAETYLGMQPSDKILLLGDLSRPVLPQMFDIAQLAFSCLAHQTPEKLYDFSGMTPAGFPFLRQAFVRLLQDLPNQHGLTRTQHQMLYSLERGVNKAGMLFARCSAMEEAQFWGDSGFMNQLTWLATGQAPLIEGLSEPFTPALFRHGERRKTFLQSPLSLSKAGFDCLEGVIDYTDLNTIDHFWAGTHLTNQNLWRYDRDEDRLIKPETIH